MSHRNVGTYGTQLLRNQYTLGAVGIRANNILQRRDFADVSKIPEYSLFTCKEEIH